MERRNTENCFTTLTCSFQTRWKRPGSPRIPELDAAAKFLAGFGTTAVIKLGANGARVVSGSQSFSAPAFAVQPVDTTGAGDSFNAGFVFQHLQGAPLQKCAAWGNACGALSTRALGGNGGVPVRI